MNIEMGQHTIPTPVPQNRPQAAPDAVPAGKGETIVQTTGKPEASVPVDETLDALMSVLPEKTEEFIGQAQDSFTQSEALSKKNELIQAWKDSYQLQQNSANGTMPQQSAGSKDFMMQQPLQPSQPGFQMPALDGNLDWGNISDEILNFIQNMGAGNVGEGLEYLISRYVALGSQVMDTQGSDRTNQRQQLEHTFSKGRRQLVDGYVNRLQNTLKLSDADAARLKNNLETMLAKRLQTYEKIAAQTKPQLTGNPKTGQDNHYMAAQLRNAVLEAGKQDSGFSLQELRGKEFSFGDMRQAGELAKGYQMLYKNAGMGAERELAADLAMVDMKLQMQIRKGAVSTRMVNLLQGSQMQRHEGVMDAADARILSRSSKTHIAANSGELVKAPLNRGLVKDIYETILHIFERNGGDPMAAIRDGLAALSGKSAEELHRSRSKKSGILYEIDGRGYAGANRPIVRVAQVGRIRDCVIGFGVLASFFALWYFMM